jgi:hypothetical protein
VWARRRAAFEELQTGLPVCDAWLEIAGGQMWSLLTTNQQGIATRTELRPTMVDGDYVVGFTWTRERAARVTKNFHNGIWAAFAIEHPETTYSAAFVPSNIMGLNTSQNASTGVNLLPFLANYSNGESMSQTSSRCEPTARSEGSCRRICFDSFDSQHSPLRISGPLPFILQGFAD